MNNSYFKRVTKLMSTKFWINNVTVEEARLAISAGAEGCTQNPSYVWKMIQNDEKREHVNGIIRKYGTLKDIDEIMKYSQRELIEEIAEEFLPMFKDSHGRKGYVSIQGNPFQEDSKSIIESAEFNCQNYQNMMVKIPVTKEGLVAIKYLSSKGYAINATEVMSVSQVLDVCDAYLEGTKDLSHKPLIYYSHITGILDEYLSNVVTKNQISIDEDLLSQSGMIVAKKCYRLSKKIDSSIGFIGGGARGLHHFTEMVGADACITINWNNTADKLLEQSPTIIDRFNSNISETVVDYLYKKIPEFKKLYFSSELNKEEYANFGPVVYFRSGFEDSWEKAIEHIHTILM